VLRSATKLTCGKPEYTCLWSTYNKNYVFVVFYNCVDIIVSIVYGDYAFVGQFYIRILKYYLIVLGDI